MSTTMMYYHVRNFWWMSCGFN